MRQNYINLISRKLHDFGFSDCEIEFARLDDMSDECLLNLLSEKTDEFIQFCSDLSMSIDESNRNHYETINMRY